MAVRASRTSFDVVVAATEREPTVWQTIGKREVLVAAEGRYEDMPTICVTPTFLVISITMKPRDTRSVL